MIIYVGQCSRLVLYGSSSDMREGQHATWYHMQFSSQAGCMTALLTRQAQKDSEGAWLWPGL